MCMDVYKHRGVGLKWNPQNTYNLAINNKTKALREMYERIDSDTVFIITSDHGHVLR